MNPGSFAAKTGAALFGLTAESARYAEREGYRVLPSDRVPKILRRIAGWSVVLFVPIWVYAFWNNVPDTGPITLFMWLSIAGLIVLAIVLVRPKRLTEKGALARDYLLGMREYLTVAEEDRMRVLQSPQECSAPYRPRPTVTRSCTSTSDSCPTRCCGASRRSGRRCYGCATRTRRPPGTAVTPSARTSSARSRPRR